MFAAQHTLSNTNDSHAACHEETWEAYGCKFRDLSKQRLDVCCSDLLFFINPKSFFMQHKKSRSFEPKQTGLNNGSDLPVQQIRIHHKIIKPQLMDELMNKSVNQLINDYLIEKNAKNQAYYFILESGLLNEFYDYCFNNKLKEVLPCKN
jgi:hypothetical protein